MANRIERVKLKDIFQYISPCNIIWVKIKGDKSFVELKDDNRHIYENDYVACGGIDADYTNEVMIIILEKE